MTMNLGMAALVFIVVSSSCIAGTKPKPATEPSPPPGLTAATLTTAELLDALKSIRGVASECEMKLSGATLLNDFKRSGRLTASERQALSNERLAVYEQSGQCKDAGKENIQARANLIVSELEKRGLRNLAKEYLSQALTLLQAVGNDNIFSAEYSKLNSLLNRIEMELSLDGGARKGDI